ILLSSLLILAQAVFSCSTARKSSGLPAALSCALDFSASDNVVLINNFFPLSQSVENSHIAYDCPPIGDQKLRNPEVRQSGKRQRCYAGNRLYRREWRGCLQSLDCPAS